MIPVFQMSQSNFMKFRSCSSGLCVDHQNSNPQEVKHIRDGRPKHQSEPVLTSLNSVCHWVGNLWKMRLTRCVTTNTHHDNML